MVDSSRTHGSKIENTLVASHEYSCVLRAFLSLSVPIERTHYTAAAAAAAAALPLVSTDNGQSLRAHSIDYYYYYYYQKCLVLVKAHTSTLLSRIIARLFT